MKQELKDRNSPIWWAISAAVVLCAACIIFNMNPENKGQFTYGDAIQAIVTFSLPFAYYVLVEKQKSDEQTRSAYFISEIDSLKALLSHDRMGIINTPTTPSTTEWFRYGKAHYDVVYTCVVVFESLKLLSAESYQSEDAEMFRKAEGMARDILNRRWAPFNSDSNFTNTITNAVLFTSDRRKWYDETVKYRKNLEEHLMDLLLCCHHLQFSITKITDMDASSWIDQRISSRQEYTQVAIDVSENK